jgi:type IV pilus assembly protein PilW
MSMRPAILSHRRDSRGFTLVELMVAVSIALFLVGGLLTIVQNMRTTYINQQALAQVQDEQRFAFTVITDSVQAAGYFPSPTTQEIDAASFPASGGFGAGTIFFGSHTAGVADQFAQDTFWMRFQSAPGYGPIICNGTDTSAPAAPAQLWTVEFSPGVDPLTGNPALMCTVNGGTPVALVEHITALAVYYGVKRNIANPDYNIDTYETWDILSASGTDVNNIGAVRVVITFTNPLAGQQNQPPTITIERVIEVMSHGGPYT